MRNYKDLQVWQEAHRLIVEVYALTWVPFSQKSDMD